MQASNKHQFIETVWQHYAEAGRELPWRQPKNDGTFDPYAILVSEIMLQQTQVTRVIPKYQSFLELFPNVQTLAVAPLAAVITAWSGLGYNRRAKFLWQAAQAVAANPNGFPTDMAGLVDLPGVGKNTAGAILAYAYNQPVAYIETNIRSVYIHHFFTGQLAVPDTAILSLVAETVDQDEPRQWYWALMDYGSYLKRTVGNAGRDSQSYVKQSTFVGSARQLRGQILKQLIAAPMTMDQLLVSLPDERLEKVLQNLLHESLIVQAENHYRLPE